MRSEVEIQIFLLFTDQVARRMEEDGSKDLGLYRGCGKALSWVLEESEPPEGFVRFRDKILKAASRPGKKEGGGSS